MAGRPSVTAFNVLSNSRRDLSNCLAGCGVVCQRWRDTYGQVEIKAAPHDRQHIEGVRLLDDVFVAQVSRR